MAPFLPRIEATLAVGANDTTGDRNFSDLVDVGGWPAKLLIKKFHLLEVYADNSRVRGIRATYKLNNGGVRASAHGHTTGAPLSLTIPFSDTTFLVGVFGSRDKAGIIVKLGFILFNADPSANPPVEIKGPVGSSNPSYTSFGSYGNIIAINGADHNDEGLKSLGFVKSEGTTSEVFEQ